MCISLVKSMNLVAADKVAEGENVVVTAVPVEAVEVETGPVDGTQTCNSAHYSYFYYLASSMDSAVLCQVASVAS